MTQYQCPDLSCPPTDFAPLPVQVFQEDAKEMCSSNAPGNCGNQTYPVGTIKRV